MSVNEHTFCTGQNNISIINLNKGLNFKREESMSLSETLVIQCVLVKAQAWS